MARICGLVSELFACPASGLNSAARNPDNCHNSDTRTDHCHIDSRHVVVIMAITTIAIVAILITRRAGLKSTRFWLSGV